MTPKPARPRVQKVQTIAKGRWRVKRKEFNDVIDRLNERAELLNSIVRNQEIQFQRIAQLQAEVDLLRRATLKKAERR